ncbi:hypothetical protein QOT17_009794 [Balamuthia mandrillaris]
MQRRRVPKMTLERQRGEAPHHPCCLGAIYKPHSRRSLQSKATPSEGSASARDRHAMEADSVEQEILLLCTMLARQWALEGNMTKQHPAGCVVEVAPATGHQSNSRAEALRRTVIITNFEEDIIQQGNIPNEVIKVFSHYEEERGTLAVIELALEVLLSTDVLVRFLFKTDAGSNPYVRMGVFLQNVGIVFGFVDKVRAELQFKHISLCWPTSKSSTPQLNGHATASSIPSSSCSASPRSSSSSSSSSPSSASTMGYTQLFSYAGGCGQDLLRKLQPNYQTQPAAAAPVAPLLPTNSASLQSVPASHNQHQGQNDNQSQSTPLQQLIGSVSNTTSASVTSTTVAPPLITSGNNSHTDGERNTLSKNIRKRSKPEKDFNKDSQLSTTQPAPTVDKGKDKVPNPNREVRKRLEEHREYVGDSDGGSDGDFDSDGSYEVDSEEEVEQTDSDTDEDEEVMQEKNKKKLKTKDNRVTEEVKPKYWKDVYHLIPESQHKHPLSITIGASLWICALCCVENVKKGYGHGPIDFLPKSARFSTHVRNLHVKELTALRSVTSGTKERVLWRCSEGQEAYMDNADFTKAHSLSWKELSQAPSVDMVLPSCKYFFSKRTQGRKDSPIKTRQNPSLVVRSQDSSTPPRPPASSAPPS